MKCEKFEILFQYLSKLSTKTDKKSRNSAPKSGGKK